MGDEQLSLFIISSNQDSTFRLPKPKQDPYWDEITREPEVKVLTVDNDFTAAQFQQKVLTVDDGELPTVSTLNFEKRVIGNGTGRIQWRNGKSGKVKQAWYDYQLSLGGKRISRSRYIPRRLLSQIQAMEAEKVPVNKILEVLGVIGLDEGIGSDSDHTLGEEIKG
jgi:hypothetical protein